MKTNYTNNWLCMKLKLDDTNCRTLAGLIKWLRKENNQRLYAVYTLGVKNQLHKDRDVKLCSKLNKFVSRSSICFFRPQDNIEVFNFYCLLTSKCIFLTSACF